MRTGFYREHLVRHLERQLGEVSYPEPALDAPFRRWDHFSLERIGEKTGARFYKGTKKAIREALLDAVEHDLWADSDPAVARWRMLRLSGSVALRGRVSRGRPGIELQRSAGRGEAGVELDAAGVFGLEYRVRGRISARCRLSARPGRDRYSLDGRFRF